MSGEGDLLHLALDRPRQFLRQLHAEATRRGEVTVRFLRPLDVGRAVLDFHVAKGHLTVCAKLEVARALGGALGAKSQNVRGLAGFDLELEGKLRSDGDVDEVLGEAKGRGLSLDPREARMMARLARVVRRVVDDGSASTARRKRLSRILRTWLREHPIWAVALLEHLLEDLEHLPLDPSVRQRRAERGGPTLDDILFGVREPGTDEIRLDMPPPPSLTWIDDHEARVVTARPEHTAGANVELRRLACVVPVLLECLE